MARIFLRAPPPSSKWSSPDQALQSQHHHGGYTLSHPHHPRKFSGTCRFFLILPSPQRLYPTGAYKNEEAQSPTSNSGKQKTQLEKMKQKHAWRFNKYCKAGEVDRLALQARPVHLRGSAQRLQHMPFGNEKFNMLFATLICLRYGWMAREGRQNQPDRNMLQQIGAIRETPLFNPPELRMTGLAFDSPYLTPSSTVRYVPPEVVRAFFETESVNLFYRKMVCLGDFWVPSLLGFYSKKYVEHRAERNLRIFLTKTR
uniref:Uncharacterized protein n=1 Tax=Tanacetum cinerariifolium TaxID=118510 RepID=A0A699ILW7_TANCI|nr:hypothetical protein [Tanacetum cinerariifolium]